MSPLVVSLFQVSSPNPVNVSSLPHTRYIPNPSHSSRFYHPKNICEQYRSLNFSLCSFVHSPLTLSLVGPNILLNTLFWNTLSLRSSFNVSDQVSNPHKTTGNIIVLYNLIFYVLDSKPEDRIFCIEWQQALSVFNLLVISPEYKVFPQIFAHNRPSKGTVIIFYVVILYCCSFPDMTTCLVLSPFATERYNFRLFL